MYNKYMPAENDVFSELYRPVEYSKEKELAAEEKEQRCGQKRKFDLKRLLQGLDVEQMGIIPLVLLLLLLHDVDDEEKLIIIALAVIFGI